MVCPLRYTHIAQEVVLVGEYPLHSADDAPEQAQSRLTDWVQGRVEPILPDDDTIEAALGEAIQGWTRRDESWVIPPDTRSPVEIVVRAVAGGVHLEATLAAIDDGETRHTSGTGRVPLPGQLACISPAWN